MRGDLAGVEMGKRKLSIVIQTYSVRQKLKDLLLVTVAVDTSLNFQLWPHTTISQFLVALKEV